MKNYLGAVALVAATAIPTWVVATPPALRPVPVTSQVSHAAPVNTVAPVAPVVTGTYPRGTSRPGPYDVKYITSFTLAQTVRDGWECFRYSAGTVYTIRGYYVCLRLKTPPTS